MIKKNHTKREELTPDSVHAGYTFVQISVSDVDHYKFQKGDIAVSVPFKGKKKYHRYGHIQMYNGKNWVSDFLQPRPFWPGRDYADMKPKYHIYRRLGY